MRVRVRIRWFAGLALAVAPACGSCERPNPGRAAVNVPLASGTADAASTPARLGAHAKPPSHDECEELWRRYQTQVHEDPFVTHEVFVERCSRSEREVLSCPERTRAELEQMARGVDPDAAAPLSEMFLRVAMPSRHGICMARERVRFAAASGELEALAAEAGRLKPDAEGIVVLEGSYSTLPTRGFIEDASGRSGRLAPFGEARMSMKSGGRAWFYFLGGLLGRHQNQLGFLYSRVPFAPDDFQREGDDERVCLDRPTDAGPSRYLLWCFTVMKRITPNLLEIGDAPD